MLATRDWRDEYRLVVAVCGERCLRDLGVLLSTRNIPTDRSTAPPVSVLMPKRREPSDEEDEVSDNARKTVSEEETVKKSKKSSAKSEKPKASTAILTRVTPIDQPQP